MLILCKKSMYIKWEQNLTQYLYKTDYSNIIKYFTLFNVRRSFVAEYLASQLSKFAGPQNGPVSILITHSRDNCARFPFWLYLQSVLYVEFAMVSGNV